ncbi:MAG: PhzF family phenazine biosynthesis protein [Ferruginibacter sp.]|nr:PhzF family phenazine biosynthesis protein [Ferruginibacter sp.]
MESLKKVHVEIINGFVDNNEGGNPAGVVFNADGLSNEDKLKIAAKIGLSETAFVSASAVADYKLDFYTPSRQIAHCGHATIATFSYLKQKLLPNKAISSKETIDGIRKIILQDDIAFMEQVAPIYTPVKNDMEKILLSLQLQTGDLIDEAAPMVVNTGNSFLLVGLKTQWTLKNLQPDPDLIAAISEQYGLIGYYVFTGETVIAGRDASCRMFAPFYGIPEESATGMAAGPLACYLYDLLKIEKNQFLIEQGYFMKTPSPSLVIVNLFLEGKKIINLMAGGKGISMQSLDIEI